MRIMYECKACGSHDVTQHAENESIPYRKGAVDVTLSYCVCNACGREFVPTEVIKQNDALIRAARRAYDGLLSPEQIRRGRQSLGLNQEDAASVFGGGANAFFKYERGAVTQSIAMDRLVRVCMNHPELLDEIRSGFQDVSTLDGL